MATVAQVLPDLARLAAETKRKTANVRQAIEAAQNEAKALSPATQLASTPKLQEIFTTPFVLAMESASSKLVAASFPPLIRLASAGVVSADSARQILRILAELQVSNQPVELQLKVLQLLPSLMSADILAKEQFLQILTVTVALAHSSNLIVANTSSATLHQIFSSLFDHLKAGSDQEDKPGSSKNTVVLDPSPEDNLSSGPEEVVLDDLSMLTYEAFCGLSAIVSGDANELFGQADLRISPQVTLEILESILPLNAAVFTEKPELSAALKYKTVPALLKVLNSPKAAYDMTVRTLRVLHVLLATQVESVSVEIEIVLSSTNLIILEATGDENAWKETLVLEFYKAILSNFAIVKRLFETFDSIDSRDNVLYDLWSVLNGYLDRHRPEMFASDIVTVPTEPLSPFHLAKSTSTMKVPLIDHLDKSEAPGGVPGLYTAALIHKSLLSFAEGASDFVASLTTDPDVSTIERDVEFINTLIETMHPNIHEMFSKFIFCSMDSENFRTSVRALQKYTHATGLLGLTAPRDDFLRMLSQSVVRVAAPEAKKSNAANLLAIGESIVESLSSTIQNSAASSPSLNSTQKLEATETDFVTSRNFNSRQVICYRALANLATSLGSTLQESWKYVWVTIQWVDYFIDGPDKFSSFYKSKELVAAGEPKLTPQDLATIQTSKDKVFESISHYHEEPFSELLAVVVDLADVATVERESDENTDSLGLCPLNKVFYLDLVSRLAKLEYGFSLYDHGHFRAVSAFFNRAATERTVAIAKRAYIIECFSTIVVTVTQRQFKNRRDTDSSAKLSLDALYSLLEALFGLGRPSEHLILNCETEMHLSILSTLHGLIDEHEEFYKNSWDLVFKILGTAFNYTGDKTSQNNKLVEKISLLISTSFETLKLILDEFLSTLPFNQLKTLTDTLVSFCSQTYDLNISFSSVSYFWLISDCINSQKGQTQSHARVIESLNQLESLLEGNEEDYEALNIYLLAKLSQLSSDSRAQVREGAIQTLFQILDIQGKQLHSWESIYNVVFPNLLSLDGCTPSADFQYRKSRIESLILVLSGLVSVYTKFIMDFGDEVNEKFCGKLVRYLQSVLQLHWNDLNAKVFQTFQDVLFVLHKLDHVEDYIKEMLFGFWISVPIEYDFVNPDYQDSLAIYNESFRLLHEMIASDLTVAQANSVINNLNKCARYPVLKSSGNDNIKPTALQKAVVQNLNLIGDSTQSQEVLANVIQQLAQIAAYPYEIRGRIEMKLKSKFDGKLKIPTFVAVSQQAFESICTQIKNVKAISVFLQANKFQRIVKSLLDLVHDRAPGVQDSGSVPSWVKCNEMILHLITRVIDENVSDIEDDVTMWKVIIDCLTVNLEGSDLDAVNVDHYQKLADVVLPIFFGLELDDLAHELIERIYTQSFLYEKNGTEQELMDSSTLDQNLSVVENQIFDKLTAFRFEEEFGTTVKCEVKDHRRIRMKCLQELFRIAHVEGFCGETAKQYVVVRSAFAIRRFIADERLLSQKPMPQIQEEELRIVLAGFHQLSKKLDEETFGKLMKLIGQSAGYIERVKDRKQGRMEKWVTVAKVWERM